MGVVVVGVVGGVVVVGVVVVVWFGGGVVVVGVMVVRWCGGCGGVLVVWLRVCGRLFKWLVGGWV